MPVAKGSILCTGHVSGKNAETKLGPSRNHQRGKGAPLHLDEDSTDIGSAMSSDVEAPYSSCFSSPCVTDNEEDKSMGRSWLRQIHGGSNNRRSNFAGTPLEPISGTPAGMSEHPPLFHMPESGASSDDCEEPQVRRQGEFRRPPGLYSPQRSRRPKGTTLLSTAPKSPARGRKGKSVAEQSVLSTAPENLVPHLHTLPASPNRRARLAIMSQAKRSEAPLKVQMGAEINFAAFKFAKSLLDPLEPVKKKPLFTDAHQISNAGEPVKKRVTPWLLAEPECVVDATAMPR